MARQRAESMKVPRTDHGVEEVDLTSTWKQAENFAAGLLLDPLLCKPLIQLQLQADDEDTALGADMFECREDDLKLRMLGRLRPPREGEKEFKAVIEICCRGSKHIENWITNFTPWLTPLEITTCSGMAHQGFATAYMAIRSKLLGNIDKCVGAGGVKDSRPVLVYVIGHSLGGALATIAAYDLATSHGYSVRCVTWGSPRVGDSKFARDYISAVPLTARFVNKTDVVTRVPANPADQFDDGPVLDGARLFLLMVQAQGDSGVNGYVHVCKGTKLGPETNGHQDALRAIGTALVQGFNTGLQQFLEVHFMKTYANNMNAILDGSAGGLEDGEQRVPDAADAFAAFGSVMGGLGRAWARSNPY